ncbi:cell cycle progression protein 1 isoform X2 [Sceloporus undulatus]|uniref:cell cycle progression protein 1 isoform X2 n=1 Tax=Sceloporus undulatus TaxID=8520 RepID=UPI001C4BC6FE|nr:cell cycle progression protein 1 isoform X2 [Sceloporus undulatus]
MSESASDSDSSCGWTVIGREGSDAEAEEGLHLLGPSEETPPPLLQGSDPRHQQKQDPATDPEAEFGHEDVSVIADQSHSEIAKTVPEDEKGKLPDDNTCVGAISDDSDIVTLEAPKVEEIGSEIGSHEGLVPCGDEEPSASEDFNMGSSSSSQYTFCQPETACWLKMLWKILVCVSGWVFPSQLSGEESSSDETSNRSSPALRRRRAKKKLISSSESEDVPPREQETEPVKHPSPKHQFSSGLNRCIILALVIAVSMGVGHFYGTVQIQERQQLVEKTHEDELNGMKDSLIQCQEEQGSKTECKSLKEGLAACLLMTEMEKKSFESQKDHLASENLHLRESLQKEEKALAVLQEELRKLREQIRHLENKGLESPVATENQKLKVHLEEEKHRMQSFVKQKETLLAEAQMLRRELDKECQLTMALREELEKLSAHQAAPEAGAGKGLPENQEIEILRGRLTELEKKLSFEQQRSDLWEKLYVEAKDHAEKQGQAGKAQQPAGKGTGKARTKPKATFFGSMKETFDAMKNSTKEFVRHHKEKIKQAKEAVKENLRKFSDSVKSTFRHFKDTTQNIFEEGEKKWYAGKRQETGRERKTASRSHEGPHHRAPGGQRERGEGRRAKDPTAPRCLKRPTYNRKTRMAHKGCTGIFDCAHQEFVSLFDKVLDPIRADEFNQLMHKYLQQEVDNFHHWRELEGFMNQFFCNGVFIHDQMLFTDFVNDIKDYLEDIKEYHGNSDRAFEDLDKYIYQYYFHYEPAPQYGPSHPALPFMQIQSGPQKRHVPKHQQRFKREGRWHKQGRANGRHTANLEIEVGQMPFQAKY